MSRTGPRAGFREARQSGSQVKLVHLDGRIAIVAVHGNRDLTRGTMGSILKQAGLTHAELRRLL